jgi:hypothetical protein
VAPTPLPEPATSATVVSGAGPAAADPARAGGVRPGQLRVVPWIDPTIERVGHDPRSAYVERFWLGVLGPSGTWLIRRLTDEIDRHPAGCTVDLAETARSIGLGTKGGRHTTILHAVDRTCEFGITRYLSDDTLALRRRLPPLTRHQIARLPPRLRAEHQQWVTSAPVVPDPAEVRRRAQQLAVSLAELGEEVSEIERQLHRWRFHPALAHEVATWAWERRHGSDPTTPSSAEAS